MNYLRPNLQRGNFTPEEEEIIIRMHKKLGNRWYVIVAELPGRTYNEVKNHWHTTLKKRVQENTVTNEEAKASKLNDNIESSTPGRDSVSNNGFDVFQVTPPATSHVSNTTGSPLLQRLSDANYVPTEMDDVKCHEGCTSGDNTPHRAIILCQISMFLALFARLQRIGVSSICFV